MVYSACMANPSTMEKFSLTLIYGPFMDRKENVNPARPPTNIMPTGNGSRQ